MHVFHRSPAVYYDCEIFDAAACQIIGLFFSGLASLASTKKHYLCFALRRRIHHLSLSFSHTISAACSLVAMAASVLWVVLAAIIAFAALACAEKSSALRYSSEHLHSKVGLVSLFDAWNAKHGKHYGPEHKAEKHKRFEIFRRNLMAIERHNRAGKSFRLGLNRFADLTHEEFRRMQRFGLKPNMARLRKVKTNAETGVLRRVSDIPDAVDWRAKGAVTAAKDQGMCGSCWAFSATGAIEGINAIATGSLVSVSEQELVTCDLGGMSEGCNGGLMDDAFEWVIRNGGIATEESYPYTSWTGEAGVCDTRLEWEEKAVTIDDYVDVESYNEDALLAAVAKQPVSVAIDGSAFDFQLYSEGIYNGTCSGDPFDTNHGVLLVGYGTEDGVDYWIVKNSWSESWGDEGFIRMIRNGSPYGICAILSMSSYPTKATVSADKAMVSTL